MKPSKRKGNKRKKKEERGRPEAETGVDKEMKSSERMMNGRDKTEDQLVFPII